MALRYSIDANKNIHGLLNIFQNKENGEFFVEGLTNVKFEFDTFKGVVRPVSANPEKGITTYFNPALFEHITQPAHKIMLLLAKLELLKGLDNLGDGNISSIISKNKSGATKSIDKMHAAADKTLLEIIKFVRPKKPVFTRSVFAKNKPGQRNKIHEAIFAVLTESKKNLICKEEALQLVEAIQTKIGIQGEQFKRSFK